MQPPAPKRVLSIQSHVVSGYVGNKAATFPLQLLGFDVDPLNTVQFSNHSGYQSFTGQRLPASGIEELLQGLERNELINYTHVLTGYNGNPESLQVIANVIEKLRTHNPGLKFVCDPVMGDAGVLYVSKEVMPIYRDVLFPIADVITPNQFEAETLLERELRTLDAMKEALKQLHSYGPRNVVISSAELEHIDPDTLVLLASHQKGQGDEATFEQFMVRFPKLRGGFTGTGDLFAALLLARLDEEEKREQAEAVQTSATDGPLARACLKVLHTMTKTLKHTMQYQKDLPPNFPLRGDSRIARACELRLIECREFIEHPTGELTAELL